jgi:hypothetical protein
MSLPPLRPGRYAKEDVMLSKKMAALAAISLISASSAAVAQSAQPLSLSQSAATASAPGTASSNDLRRRGAGIYIIGAIVLGLIIWGIIELTKNGNNPHSP